MSSSSTSSKSQRQVFDLAIFWERYTYLMRRMEKLENMIEVMERLLDSQSDRVKEAFSMAIEAKRAVSAIIEPEQPCEKQKPVTVGACRVINFSSACNK